MATPAMDPDRITVVSVADVSDTAQTFTKPDGARAFQVYSAVAYLLHGGNRSTVGGGASVTPGATNSWPLAAGAYSDIYPCGQLANVKITAAAGNLGNVAIVWIY